LGGDQPLRDGFMAKRIKECSMRNSILVLAMFLAACGQSDQTVTYKDSEGKERSLEVSDSGADRTVTSDDGLIKAKGSQGGEKARFPAYAPQYPGAKVQSVVDMDVGQSGSTKITQHIITMHTPHAPDAVISFYRAKISAAGKSMKEVKSGTGPMLMIGGSSPLDMEGAITAMPVASGGTSVNVSVTAKVPPN
jgi:hypothetical protein